MASNEEEPTQGEKGTPTNAIDIVESQIQNNALNLQVVPAQDLDNKERENNAPTNKSSVEKMWDHISTKAPISKEDYSRAFRIAKSFFSFHIFDTPDPELVKASFKPYSPEYFLAESAMGATAVGLSHLIFTPFDFAKTKIQLNSDYSKLGPTMRNLFQGDLFLEGYPLRGLAPLYRGWLPVGVGYSLLGFYRFGLYSILKSATIGTVGLDNAYYVQDGIHLCAAAVAESLSCFLLCPFENIKLYMQMFPSEETFSEVSKSFFRTGLAYQGFAALLARQVPQTVLTFAGYERFSSLYYSFYNKPRSELTFVEKTSTTLSAGFSAGALAAVITHPADTIFSRVGQLLMTGNTWDKTKLVFYGTKAAPGIGWAGVWKGLGARAFLIGSLASIQWTTYAYARDVLDFPSPGGIYEYVENRSKSKYDVQLNVPPASSSSAQSELELIPYEGNDQAEAKLNKMQEKLDELSADEKLVKHLQGVLGRKDEK